MPKLKWNVDPAPYGPYRYFQERGWPHATYSDGSPAARISCSDKYIPSKVKTGEHSELKVYVAKWNHNRKPEEAAFEWKLLKKRATTLSEAKELAAKFIESFPDFVKPDIE